jgi:hypothetical protein
MYYGVSFPYIEPLCGVFENSLTTWIGNNTARLLGSQEVLK